MKLGKVTKRWLLTTIPIVCVFVLFIVILVASYFQNMYYNSVTATLELKDGELISTYFNVNTGASDISFNEAAADFVENFSDKNIMSVWVIDTKRRVINTSSGFPVQFVNDPDYEKAIESNESVISQPHVLSSTGEKVKMMTTPIQLPIGTAAVRYIISLEDIDAQLKKIDIVIVFAALIVIVLFIIPGTIFVQNAVKSIQEINLAARQIAEGKLDTRVRSSNHDDEIGELCNSINNMAEEIGNSDKIKNDFLSTISHELRTPLTAIRGWGETLEDVGNGDPELTKRGMKVIINESSRLAVMVEELLDFSRMQNGKLSLRIEKIDVLAELDETVFSFKERATREGIELLYNAVNLPAPMDADPNRIKQVFVNILDNAIKYTQQGGKILVEAKYSAPTVLEITVSDTGNGISKDDLPHIKEKFYKADMSARGSGIGLAVVDEIIRLHKGEWTIDSVLGKGTTVTILLPVEEVITEEIGLNEQEEQ